MEASDEELNDGIDSFIDQMLGPEEVDGAVVRIAC